MCISGFFWLVEWHNDEGIDLTSVLVVNPFLDVPSGQAPEVKNLNDHCSASPAPPSLFSNTGITMST